MRKRAHRQLARNAQPSKAFFAAGHDQPGAFRRHAQQVAEGLERSAERGEPVAGVPADRGGAPACAMSGRSTSGTQQLPVAGDATPAGSDGLVRKLPGLVRGFFAHLHLRRITTAARKPPFLSTYL